MRLMLQHWCRRLKNYFLAFRPSACELQLQATICGARTDWYDGPIVMDHFDFQRGAIMW